MGWRLGVFLGCAAPEASPHLSRWCPFLLLTFTLDAAPSSYSHPLSMLPPPRRQARVLIATDVKKCDAVISSKLTKSDKPIKTMQVGK